MRSNNIKGNIPTLKDRRRLSIYIPNHIQPVEYTIHSPKKPDNKPEKPFLNSRKLIQTAANGKETKNPPDGPKMWTIPPEKPANTGKPITPNNK